MFFCPSYLVFVFLKGNRKIEIPAINARTKVGGGRENQREGQPLMWRMAPKKGGKKRKEEIGNRTK